MLRRIVRPRRRVHPLRFPRRVVVGHRGVRIERDAYGADAQTRKTLSRSVAGPDKGVTNKAVTKKGGAGGRGAWGVAGAEGCAAAIDKGDPNYDDEANASVLECSES